MMVQSRRHSNGLDDSHYFVAGANPALMRPKRYYVDNRRTKACDCNCPTCTRGRRRDMALNPVTVIIGIVFMIVCFGYFAFAIIRSW